MRRERETDRKREGGEKEGRIEKERGREGKKKKQRENSWVSKRRMKYDY